MKLLSKYLAINLKGQLQYKKSFFLTIFGQFLTAFGQFFCIQFLFSRFHAVQGFTYGQTLLAFAVVTLSFSFGELLGGGFASFPLLLGNGGFDRILIRPRSPIFQVLVPEMDLTRLGLTLQAAVTLWIAVPACGVSWTAGKVLVLVLMILCGSAVFFGLFLLYGSCSFLTTSGLEFFNLFTYGGRDFGRYPYGIYGKPVLLILTFVVPLALFQYYPLLYLTGRSGSLLFALAPLGGLLFLLPSYLIFRLGLRRYRSIGS